MWKVFNYDGRLRLAYIPEAGPAYQVIDGDKMAPGFRSFKAEKMIEVASADHMFDLIPEDILEKYPLLEKAK